MNMAIRGIDASIAFGDTLHNDKQKDLKADFVIANPPFNVSDWVASYFRMMCDGNSAYRQKAMPTLAWMQHFIHHLHQKELRALCSPMVQCRASLAVRVIFASRL